MIGSGTQTDPFIVDNWTEFAGLANLTTTEIYVKWADAENKIIDFNDIMPEGFSETIIFPANVDFNGWTLKNLCSSASVGIKGITTNQKSNILNLNVENFYFTGGTSFSYLDFENCSFAGQGYSTGSFFFSSQCFFKNCAINIQMYTNAQGCIFNSTNCKNSDIIINISGSRVMITKDCFLYNSRLSGTISVTSEPVNISIGYPCVVNVESNQVFKLISGAGVSVFNSDLAGIFSVSSNLVGVNSEQIKNPEYLASISFPIGVN